MFLGDLREILKKKDDEIHYLRNQLQVLALRIEELEEELRKGRVA